MSDSEDMQVDEALLPSVEEAQKKLNAAEVALAAKQEEVDKNTASAILRREELYFTRTSLLKEQLRLRGELEPKLQR